MSSLMRQVKLRSVNMFHYSSHLAALCENYASLEMTCNYLPMVRMTLETCKIGEFMSQHVYKGKLKSNPSHPVSASTIACHFVDVNGMEQLDTGGKSSFNQQEVEAVILIAEHLQEENVPFRIITPYDAQRSAIEQALQGGGLNWHDKCFNVDSFQGNEDHVIIISVVRSKELGFLTSLQRTNVMLTRCQRGMYIVSSRGFLEGKGADSLVGKMAAELGKRPGAWLTLSDLSEGRFE
ncbi:AAA domain-containing protein [Multifurca ochricompacta]|uniref:AAA domain-containing protein n=1 Tax=Multifurca ochricompacta TaxID=376703 RepID=A0AAD4M6J0_9AGAM|nr:AAA domain-containing protein [Multifurca ochricompacta]